MLGIGKVPRVVRPCRDEFGGLVFPAGTLRIEEPNDPLATDAVTDDTDEGLFGKRDADCGQGGGKGRVAGGGG